MPILINDKSVPVTPYENPYFSCKILTITPLEIEHSALEKEAAGVSGKIDQINGAYKKTWEQGVKASQANKSAKAEYNAFASGFKAKFDELQKQLNALVKEIPEDVLSEYLVLRKSQKLPVYVEYDAENKVCGRCRMEVPNDVCAKLKSAGDFAECPSCRRIMYVPESK